MSNIDFIKLSEEGYNVWIKGNHCYRCNYEWKSSSPKEPRVCPKCKSSYWNRPRNDEKENVQNKIELEAKAVMMHKLFDQSIETRYDAVISLIGKIDDELYDAVQEYHETKAQQLVDKQKEKEPDILSESDIEEFTHKVVNDGESLKQMDPDVIDRLLQALGHQ
ncbi:hypothetical protein LI82_02090 [Methanococcoides methylutens]|uniref:Uncharacterized protein n=1 Tax=Methanococcoides methylutens TaxID=2226 RepID=A0A099T5S9_METMT|nr:hypothetical protein [Methanococcoides methylutens]KGK99561.1 hypothetical protein LI82_02090 [Methanococcoides methylutens]